MGWFTKESHTHFNRDEDGKVVSVERSGAETSGDYLIQKHREEHPTRWMKFKSDVKQRSEEAYVQKKKERQVFREAYRDARIKRMKQEGGMAAYGFRNPSYKKPGKPKYAKLDQPDTLNSMFNLGGRTSYKKKNKGTKQYVIVGGKAYEKAGSGQRKHKGNKKKRKSLNDEMKDIMNIKPW